MKGGLVILRALGATPLMRRVGDYDVNAVYVTMVSEKSSEKPLISKGFPFTGVFRCDSKIVDYMKRIKEWDWGGIRTSNALTFFLPPCFSGLDGYLFALLCR